jgi:DNA-binding GntR family transcriptional regulator
MKKLKIPNNLTTLAFNSIKEYILDGKMDADSRLTEDFLSNQLGISKSPIREALNRLEAGGLIRIEPRKGAYLRRLSVEEINELYDLREALEVHVVRTASLTPALLAELRQSLKRQRVLLKANEKAHYIQEDASFHAKLAQSTKNSYLCSVLENIQNQIWLSRRASYDLSSSTAPDYHDAILKALEDSDSDKAQEAMRAHIRNVRERLVRSFEHKLPAGSASQ